MKFKKLLFGLAGFPLLLASCSQNILSYDETKTWIKNHYDKSTESLNTLITLGWDYHATTNNEKALSVVRSIFDTLKEEAFLETEEDLSGIIHFPEGKGTIGEEVRIEPECIIKIPPLTSSIFDHYGKEDPDKAGTYIESFRINNNALTTMYTNDLPLSLALVGADKIPNVSFVRVYNDKGYITGYGIKISKYIPDETEKDTVVKLKITLNFEYSR